MSRTDRTHSKKANELPRKKLRRVAKNGVNAPTGFPKEQKTWNFPDEGITVAVTRSGKVMQYVHNGANL